ncbi:MAG: ribosomal L7Ae/L30e/S12e/Gadd45 family protein [Lachnospiraceae bacterium]|nr:ribosomal L7Ae/L30e/S12e/Gadd45 family protein [Lachnospiraceae bacterium]
MSPDRKFLNMLGIATKAGKVVSGEFATEKAIKEQKACFVMVAEDASQNTKKLFTDKCSFYEVPIVICSSKEELGHAIGKASRASIAVTEQGLANAIAKYFDRNDMEVV